MRRREVSKTLANSSVSNLSEVADSITEIPLRAIAEEIVEVVEGVNSGQMNYEKARLLLISCKILTNIVALGKLK